MHYIKVKFPAVLLWGAPPLSERNLLSKIRRVVAAANVQQKANDGFPHPLILHAMDNMCFRLMMLLSSCVL